RVAGQHLAQRLGDEREDLARERQQADERHPDRDRALEQPRPQLDEMGEQRAFRQLLFFLAGGGLLVVRHETPFRARRSAVSASGGASAAGSTGAAVSGAAWAAGAAASCADDASSGFGVAA